MMKTIRLYTLAVATGMAAAIFSACQDDFDAPALDVPKATMTANTSILELKEQYWSDADNYIDTVKLTASGEHVIIAGRVISSDESGNIFKSLVIQDATSALSMSIDANSMNNTYRIGQEVVIDMTDLYLGKYSGLQQLGFPDYSTRYGWQAGRLPLEMFKLHSQLNGLPEPSKVDTVLTTLTELNSSMAPAGLRKWQGQLIRLNDVYFEGGGELPFSESDASTSRTLMDSHGNSIVVRNSNYASFKSAILPEGHGDVVAILSYYNNAWQLLLRSKSDCMNFGNPTTAPGTEENPYTVDQARELVGQSASGWMRGYIVGVVAPEVTEIAGDNDIEWDAPFTLSNTLVIGPAPDCHKINECFVLPLPQGSALQEYGNLKSHPELLGREITVNGSFDKYMDANGIANNSGSATEFKIEGVDVPGGDIPAPDGDGSEANPYSVAQVLNGTATGTTWVTGYIVGWIDGKTLSDGARFSVPATVSSNILIAAGQGETDLAKCIPVQLPSGSVRSALNLVDHPDNLGKQVSLKASVEKYFGTTGLKSASAYNIEGAPDLPVTPVDPVASIDENFDASTNVPAGWTLKVIEGNKEWYVPTFNNNNYAACTGYKGTAPFDSWLVSPPIAADKLTAKTLEFVTQVNGYGSSTSSLEVYILTSADPATAGKTRLDPTLATAPASGYSSWENSGTLSLSAASGTFYIGFRYAATVDPAGNYATWCVDNVVVK